MVLVRGRDEVFSAWLKCRVSKCKCVVSAWRIPTKGGQRKPSRNGLPIAEEAAGGWKQRMFPWAGGFMSAEVYPVAHPVGIQGSKGFLPVSPFTVGPREGFPADQTLPPNLWFFDMLVCTSVFESSDTRLD